MAAGKDQAKALVRDFAAFNFRLGNNRSKGVSKLGLNLFRKEDLAPESVDRFVPRSLDDPCAW
jgi:hypothetical protein